MNVPRIALIFPFFVQIACVPPGNAPPFDGGATEGAVVVQSKDVLKAVFEEKFDRVQVDGVAIAEPSPDGSAEAATAAPDLGPDWAQIGTSAWHVESGRLCGQGARNHGVWLKRVLPINARIEFDAVSYSPDGDLKAEIWGDGRSVATTVSYTNASSYLVIYGGWKNTLHVLARINEHGKDRREVKTDPKSDDPRQRPVVPGQTYRFRVERNDGVTVRWFVDNVEMLSFVDSAPLAGVGHDHLAFNNWEARVCFDNVVVTPL